MSGTSSRNVQQKEVLLSRRHAHKTLVDLGGGSARRASFFYHSPPVPVPPPPSPNNLEYPLAVSQNLAHPLHPVYDDGKGGGWKWWE